MASLKWSRQTGWAALALAAACAVALAALLATIAIKSGLGALAVLLLLAFGAIASFIALFANQGAPWKEGRWSAWLQPRPIAFIFLAMFAGLGMMGNVQSLLASLWSRPGVRESEPGAIEKGVKQILTEVAPPPAAPARIRLKLPGVWGEPGCAVTYRFRIEDRALLVDAERRPEGERPYRLVATIINAEGDAMNVTGEAPEAARGKAATFGYATNGAIERLTWDDQVRPVPIKLDRCG